MFLKRSFLTALLPLLFISMLIAACGSDTTTTGSGNTPAATTPTTAPAEAVIKTASATVGGKSETILTNAQGMTLYYVTTDKGTSICSAACAKNWPPLLFTGTGTPTSATSLPGTLATASNSNGTQVSYQGHLLYTFVGDKAAGDTTGQGVKGVWFVATPDLQSGDSAASVVKTASATVGGKSETILTNAQGMTLYYVTTDKGTSICSAACAQNWPPLLSTGSSTPTSATSLPGKLTAVTNANGTQVEYQGHLLYTFVGDKAAGDTTGQGVKGVWFVATPDLKEASTSSSAPAAPTPTPSTNGGY